jgi:(1->4)-alpha-D-glucan 1-alpha-D-glucosylmutase
MRILALAEMPNEWRDAVSRWADMNGHHLLKDTNGGRQPSPAHEYMLYQALIGSWPLSELDESFVKRMEGYAIKAAREGKQETSWTAPNHAYEKALTAFLREILSCDRSQPFISDFSNFAQRTALLGALNSLSQLTLKALMPGIPDFFQGTEFFDLSLVDPDNRRPVDYAMRSAAASDAINWAALAATWQDGRIKFALMRRLLHIRNAYPALFRDGRYAPVALEGEHAGIVAFERNRGKQRIIVVAGRHFAGITDGGRRWPGQWSGSIGPRLSNCFHDLLRDSRIETAELGELLGELPVAVLLRCG